MTEVTDRSLAWRLAMVARCGLEADGAWLTLDAAGAHRFTLACTDDVAEGLDQVEDVVGQGPCWDAQLTGRLQVLDLAVTTATRWSQFAQSALAAVGPCRIASVPMQPDGVMVGVLSLYWAETAFPAADWACELTARVIGSAIVARWQEVSDPDQPANASAWARRAEVHQAVGVVMEQLSLSSPDALAALRSRAFVDGVTLTELSRLVVRRSVDLSMADG